MKKILFIDRDGTIIKEPSGDFQVDSLDKLEFVPGVITALRRIVQETDYRLVMVSNQDGLGTPAFPMADFLPPQQLMLKTLAGEGVVFDEILIDKSFPAEHSPFRKPGTGMVAKYLNEFLDTDNSYVIGDRQSDMQLAANMEIKGIFFGDDSGERLPIALCSPNWNDIFTFLKQGGRRVTKERKTTETSVMISLDLNQAEICRIDTGLGFFNHLLEQISRHGGLGLEISVAGDLQVDEHHTIEDTGIVLGECFAVALGAKKGIERYGFSLPMDEARAEVLLDFGGRAWLEWDVDLKREYVGDFPTEMAKHFFASFCQGCGCNLQVSARGENTHHILEAVFKAFARAVKVAIRQTGTAIPSSKGII